MSDDRIDFAPSPQQVRAHGDHVAYRSDQMEPGRWWLINEARWLTEADVADWEIL